LLWKLYKNFYEKKIVEKEMKYLGMVVCLLSFLFTTASIGREPVQLGPQTKLISVNAVTKNKIGYWSVTNIPQRGVSVKDHVLVDCKKQYFKVDSAYVHNGFDAQGSPQFRLDVSTEGWKPIVPDSPSDIARKLYCK
jgi:hypothetical protein